MKKKISGQTIIIIVLIILLLLVLAFGGVYAFYSTSTGKVSGRIIMANLNIDFKQTGTGSTGASEILISNNTDVVPNESLQNSPLIVVNGSNTPIYLAVLYKVTAYKRDSSQAVDYDISNAPIDVGVDNVQWTDYLYSYSNGSEVTKFRCLMLLVPSVDKEITVIGENKLKLNKNVGNEFQNAIISFTFQAYAIASNSFEEIPNETNSQKCQRILEAINEAYNYSLSI